ncbi:MAG TPA: hypothetical protein VNL16_05215 [Chloroflexota bacterium]|nr:hypothetical protein [Chloroflexota bacterium]
MEAPENLGEALSTLTVESLKPLARQCVPNPPTRKAELIAAICHALESHDFLAALVKQADKKTLLALSEAVYAGGAFEPARFEAKYGIAFKPPTHQQSGYGPSGWARNASQSVADLFFYHGRVPTDLVTRLRALVPAPRPSVVRSEEGLPETVEGHRDEAVSLTPLLTEEAALHDLLATLMLVGQGKLAIGDATHQPTGAAVRLLRERLLLPDVVPSEEKPRADAAIRPFALTMIVQAAGLAKASATRLVLTKGGQAALDAPSPGLLKQCWDAWAGWDKLDELSRVRGIKGQRSRGRRFSAPSERKAAIAGALASCTAGRWIAIDEFFRFVRSGKHDFAVEVGDYSELYVGYSMEEGWLGYDGADTWWAVNTAYIRVILLEYAATLGLIDVATIPLDETVLDFKTYAEIDPGEFSRYGGLEYFRVNNLGSYILGKSEQYAGPAVREEQPVLKVLPSLDVVVDRASLTPNDRAVLERFATHVSDDVYKLSRDRLLDAAENGVATDDAEAFLRRRGSQDLPQTARVLFEDVARGVAAIQGTTPALLVRCVDSHTAQLISHDGVLGKLCLLAGDNHVVVASGQLAAFRRGLRRLGFALAEGASSPSSRG